MSSSSISVSYIRGKTGPLGPDGPSGGIGPTGPAGPTGGTGGIGLYYVNYEPINNNIKLNFSDQSSITIIGSFRGATTEDRSPQAITGINATGGAQIFESISGGTFNIRGICAYGSLYASITGPCGEHISIDTIYWGQNKLGNYDSPSMSANKLIYLKDPFTIYGASLGFSAANVDQGWRNPIDFSSTFNLNAGTKTLNIGPVPYGSVSGLTSERLSPGSTGTTLGVFLDTNAAGAFVLRTPIGIQGITGTFYRGEIASITILIDSDNIWNFPENVYFEPDENYLSCGKNILGLFTYDGGNTWIASVSHRGHGIQNASRQCIPGNLWGSCCIQNADGSLDCVDYVDKTFCDRRFGTFNPASPCESSCGSKVSICCKGDGNCLSNVSSTLCTQFGGKYWSGLTCDNYISDGPNYADPIENGRFCYDTCGATYDVYCCKNGRCLGKYTRIQCETILGGVSRKADIGLSCSDINCCDSESVPGACCKCLNSSGQFEPTCLGVLTPEECRNQNGIFAGPNKSCDQVSCGCICVAEVTGACCVGGTCSQKSIEECSAANGTFMGQDVPCQCVNCLHGETFNAIAIDSPECSPIGACCIGSECLTTSQASCLALNGRFAGAGTDCLDNNQNYCNARCGSVFPPPNTSPCACGSTRPAWCNGGRGPRPVNRGCCCVSVRNTEIDSDTFNNFGWRSERSECSGSFSGGSSCSGVCNPCTTPPCSFGPNQRPIFTNFCNDNPDACRGCGDDPDCGIHVCDIAPGLCYVCSNDCTPSGGDDGETHEVDGQECTCGDNPDLPYCGDEYCQGVIFNFEGIFLNFGNQLSGVLPTTRPSDILGFDPDGPLLGINSPTNPDWADSTSTQRLLSTPTETNVKVTINNVDFCVPIVCRGDCGQYTPCE